MTEYEESVRHQDYLRLKERANFTLCSLSNILRNVTNSAETRTAILQMARARSPWRETRTLTLLQEVLTYTMYNVTCGTCGEFETPGAYELLRLSA